MLKQGRVTNSTLFSMHKIKYIDKGGGMLCFGIYTLQYIAALTCRCFIYILAETGQKEHGHQEKEGSAGTPS